ncbi:hypothetical protein B0H34DRAFT_690781 [Crassisporium funariophilum]|nr:hypothetical protein B0H34DRAFT_690781 [Crassisporium funariophilum]
MGRRRSPLRYASVQFLLVGLGNSNTSLLHLSNIHTSTASLGRDGVPDPTNSLSNNPTRPARREHPTMHTTHNHHNHHNHSHHNHSPHNHHINKNKNENKKSRLSHIRNQKSGFTTQCTQPHNLLLFSFSFSFSSSFSSAQAPKRLYPHSLPVSRSCPTSILLQSFPAFLRVIHGHTRIAQQNRTYNIPTSLMISFLSSLPLLPYLLTYLPI